MNRPSLLSKLLFAIVATLAIGLASWLLTRSEPAITRETAPASSKPVAATPADPSPAPSIAPTTPDAPAITAASPTPTVPPPGPTPAVAASPSPGPILAASNNAVVDPPESAAEILREAGSLSDPSRRQQAVRRLQAIELMRREDLFAEARARGLPERVERPDGTVIELKEFRDGEPVYRITHNANAAISTGAATLHAAPYQLTAANVTVAEWDAGSARTTHQEFGSRVSARDGASADDHATHVGGTLIASGVTASAKGMAPAASLDSYDWDDDISEMTARGASYPGEAGAVPISNHSYGEITGWYETGYTSPEWTWYGSGSSSTSTDDDFGKYSTSAQDSDAVAASLPYFLMFRSAGNDRIDNPSNGDSVSLSSTSPTTTTYSSSSHPGGDGSYRGGYDSISADAVSKNVVTVGAVNDAVSGGARSVAAAGMTSFSSWGPTDDGRIKPDLVANGYQLYSASSSGTAAYQTLSGTSMASPNAAGSAALLVGFYKTLFPGQALRAATLKGLLLHTADDLGATGPDYVYGWGLLNVRAAADLLQRQKDTPGARVLTEDRVTTAANSRSYTFTWDGSSPIRATLSWTDPAGATTTSGDSRTARLVNDLDLVIVDPAGATHRPYVMPYVGDWSTAKLSAAATTGANHVDNVEQVYLAAPPQAGIYTVQVSVTGSLTDDAQNFSVILSGATGSPLAAPTLTGVDPATASAGGAATLTLNGSNFALGATVRLTKNGESDLEAYGVEVSADQIIARVDLATAAAGPWNVVVTNPDGQSATLNAAVTVNAALWSENFEGDTSGWSRSASTGSTTNWALTTSRSRSASHSFASTTPTGARNVDDLYAPAISIPAGATNLQLSFWHSYSYASTTAGGVLELSVDGGSTWSDVTASGSGASFAAGGYSSTLSSFGPSSFANPLAGRSAWSGSNSSFTQVVVNLSAGTYAGKTLRLRWRNSTGFQPNSSAGSWYLDDIVLAGSTPNTAPTVSAVSASPTTVTGLTTTVSVTAADSDDGESALTYAWSASGPSGVSFSPNTTNAAKSSVATFSAAGSYTLTATATDPDGSTASGSVAVTVQSSASAVTVSPASASVSKGGAQSFSAQLVDQFGATVSSQPSFAWSVDGGGTISPAGLFTAGSIAGGPYQVTATGAGLGGSAVVTVLGQSLADWQAENFGAGDDLSETGDPDADGVPNLLEYALGSDPLATTLPPTASLVDGYLTLSFERPRYLPGVVYSVQISSDLKEWTALTTSVTVNGDTETVTARDPTPASNLTRRFIRLVVFLSE